MSKKISFIYLDLGGVIATWDGVAEEVSKITGKNIEDVRMYVDAFDKLGVLARFTSNEMWEEIQKGLKVTYSNIEYPKIIYSCFKEIKETFEVLPELKQQYKIGMLSNIYTGVIETAIENNFFNIAFDQIVKSCDYGIAKPNKKIYEIATKISNEKKENILFVDDSKHNVDSAREFGWNTILFNTSDPKKSVDEIKLFLGV